MKPEFATWNVRRIWSATTDDKTEQLGTLELSRFRGLVMLGTAGAGKTTEAARLANHERASGACVRECRLAEFADTSSQLAERLRQMSSGADQNTVFYLDALDEAMIPARRCWLAIKHWVTDDLQGTAASVRITCRSAVWPSKLTQVIRNFTANRPFATALLHALSDDDIRAAAASHGIDPTAFLKRIRSFGARSLAEQPLSLRMLIRLHQSSHGLPASLKDLFDKGLQLLASDPHDRREIDTQNPLPPDKLLEAAERLACYMILAGSETVHCGDEPLPNQLTLPELSRNVTREELDAIRWSGISDSTAPESFRFAHRQFAEYLAGRRLARLPIHQSRAFLANPDGWNNGVAGPLRETAAFTAMFNADVAHWIASRDPDVIGLSDVADPGLRRAATLALLDQCRRGEMTARQLPLDTFATKGLRYPDAFADLRPVLASKGDGCDDLIECALELTRSWEISTSSHDLANLALDSTVPIHARVGAGYALRDCGQSSERQRLKPLIFGLPEDTDDELKGIALRCNWPDHMSTPELLRALTPRQRPLLSGAYGRFLRELNEDRFDATGHLAAGLRWARDQASASSHTDVMHRIAMRIAQNALHHLRDAVVARALTELLNAWARHHTSPLARISQRPLSRAERSDKAPLHTNRDARRRLIDLLTTAIQTRQDMMTIASCTPGLRNEEDFRWLLTRASNEGYPMVARENYLLLACRLPWQYRSENVDAWLRVCDDEPVKSILGNERCLELDSDRARQLRNDWKTNADRPCGRKVRPLNPPPCRRVMDVLRLAETTDIRYFRTLCRELTLRPTSTMYDDFQQRFLTRTPGWQEADTHVRNRIVEAAKSYLSNADVAAESVQAVTPKSFHGDVMGALWLLLERAPDWLKAQRGPWWGNWCWYILRELVPDLTDEPQEPKQHILRLLNENIPATFRHEIMMLASRPDDEFADVLPSLLRLLMDIPNRELDKTLCDALCTGGITQRGATVVAEFVLTRAPSLSVRACLDMFKETLDMEDEALEHAAVGLLGKASREAWPVLYGFLRSSPERGRRILGHVAHKSGTRLVDSLVTPQMGELAEVLIELFPPETDPKNDGPYSVTPDESARTLRAELLSRLAALEDADAVTALRRLEDRFDRYPWIRLLRSDAERRLRLSRWSPFSVAVVADVLGAAATRLLRSEDDVIDGIEYALENYEVALGRDGGESPEDLWNTARDATPKAEEHVSSKLCGAVRAYFRECAIAAGREVEIRRRRVARSSGGEPGSKVDILVQAPARGTVSGDAVRVPIEVKLSSNDEARTAIRAQLAERYMPELGASHGVYVVVWMSLPRPDELRKRHRPKWVSIEAAREDLRQEAERVSKERGIHIRTIVVDGSLR